MQQQNLQEYAALITRIGTNVQKGQTVVISCPVDCAYFARMLAEEAYNAGAREVVMRWGDDALTRMKYLRGDDTIFDETPQWLVEFYNHYAAERAALISVYATDPELLKGVDPNRIQRAGRSSGLALKDFQNKQMSNDFPWCVVSVPTASWAGKVFPGETAERAAERLWDAIFTATHVGGGKAVDTWRAKMDTMARRAKILNDYSFKKLIYKNSLGTDLEVELPEAHQWGACGEKAGNGVVFAANIPTEEIFTLPKRDGVNGVLYTSMPLSLSGNLIENIVFTFKDGKIIDAKASSGLEILEKQLDMDEGARYLGEVALVPYHSPISDMNILFYNTLFDENASCHFAFGKAYPNFHDAGERTEEELKARGMNDSLTHIDFMVGTADLSIIGVTADGQEIPVFVDGDFAF